MLPSKEYLDQIANKLDSLNKMNGVDPAMRSQLFNDSFDLMDYTGKAALEYMKKKNQEDPQLPDPLFTDHNKY
jgi:hypothetical protein